MEKELIEHISELVGGNVPSLHSLSFPAYRGEIVIINLKRKEQLVSLTAIRVKSFLYNKGKENQCKIDIPLSKIASQKIPKDGELFLRYKVNYGENGFGTGTLTTINKKIFERAQEQERERNGSISFEL